MRSKTKSLRRTKCLRNAQETTYTKPMKMTVTIQDLRMEFNNEIETLKRTQSEMKMQLKKYSNYTKKTQRKSELKDYIKQNKKYLW